MVAVKTCSSYPDDPSAWSASAHFLFPQEVVGWTWLYVHVLDRSGLFSNISTRNGLGIILSVLPDTS
jgi:hypothetical protein